MHGNHPSATSCQTNHNCWALTVRVFIFRNCFDVSKLKDLAAGQALRTQLFSVVWGGKMTTKDMPPRPNYAWGYLMMRVSPGGRFAMNAAEAGSESLPRFTRPTPPRKSWTA